MIFTSHHCNGYLHENRKGQRQLSSCHPPLFLGYTSAQTCAWTCQCAHCRAKSFSPPLVWWELLWIWRATARTKNSAIHCTYSLASKGNSNSPASTWTKECANRQDYYKQRCHNHITATTAATTATTATATTTTTTTTTNNNNNNNNNNDKRNSHSTSVLPKVLLPHITLVLHPSPTSWFSSTGHLNNISCASCTRNFHSEAQSAVQNSRPSNISCTAWRLESWKIQTKGLMAT